MKKFDYPYGIFTSLPPRTPLLEETFDRLYYTNHKKVNLHHSLLVAPKDVIEDPQLRDEVIRDCWYNHGCNDAVITPWGCFGCEIMSVIARITGEQGYPITPGWWKRESYEDQLGFCQMCGLCVPMPLTTDKDEKEYVTPSMYQALVRARSPALGRLEMYNVKLTRADIEARKQNRADLNLSLRIHRERKRGDVPQGLFF